jgi:hypothetical protein
MARHNDILTQFREIIPIFDYKNPSHKNLVSRSAQGPPEKGENAVPAEPKKFAQTAKHANYQQTSHHRDPFQLDLILSRNQIGIRGF